MDVLREARRAVDAGRVFLVEFFGRSRFFLVEGRDRRRAYVVIPGMYCSCPDYLFSVFLRRERRACYHMVAAEIAEREGKFRLIRVEKEEEWDSIYEKIISGIIG